MPAITSAFIVTVRWPDVAVVMGETVAAVLAQIRVVGSQV